MIDKLMFYTPDMRWWWWCKKQPFQIWKIR